MMLTLLVFVAVASAETILQEGDGIADVDIEDIKPEPLLSPPIVVPLYEDGHYLVAWVTPNGYVRWAINTMSNLRSKRLTWRDWETMTKPEFIDYTNYLMKRIQKYPNIFPQRFALEAHCKRFKEYRHYCNETMKSWIKDIPLYADGQSPWKRIVAFYNEELDTQTYFNTYPTILSQKDWQHLTSNSTLDRINNLFESIEDEETTMVNGANPIIPKIG